MYRCVLTGVILACTVAAMAQAPSIAGGESLEHLAARGALVTVVIKTPAGSKAIPNLRIADVHPGHFNVIDEDGIPYPYLFEDVVEVRVQKDAVATRAFALPTKLTRDQQAVLDHAIERTRNLFQQEQRDQKIRMRAAVLLAFYDDRDALAYLLERSRGDAIETALMAATYLYLVGNPAVMPGVAFPLDALPRGATDTPSSAEDRRPLVPDLLARGLGHGSREVRAQAAMLAGLVNAQSLVTEVRNQMNDRIAELSAPAAKAMANMGERDAIPRLLDLIMERTEEKGEAAIYGLKMLGDVETIAALKRLEPSAKGLIRLRFGRVLSALGDPMGRRILEDIMHEMPTVADYAALELAERGSSEAIQRLRDRLAKRENPTEVNLRFRAQAAAALYRAGEPSALSKLSELLRGEEPLVIEKVTATVAELGRTSLLVLLPAPLERDNPEVMLDAAYAAVALANDGFRARLNRYRASR